MGDGSDVSAMYMHDSKWKHCGDGIAVSDITVKNSTSLVVPWGWELFSMHVSSVLRTRFGI